MTHDTEDYTAAKLKGNNILIKFIDGETLFMTIGGLDAVDKVADWLSDVEDYMNGSSDCFPVYGIAAGRQHIKYVKLL